MEKFNAIGSINELIDSPQWKIVKHFFKEGVRPPNTVLIQQGAPSGGLIVLKSGQIEITKKIPGGRHLKLGNVAEGGHIGEVSLIDGQPNMVCATSLTEVRFIYLDQSYYEALCTGFPDLNFHLMQILIFKALNKQKQYIKNIVTFLNKEPSLKKNYKAYDLNESVLMDGFLYKSSRTTILNKHRSMMHFTDDEESLLKSYSKPVFIKDESCFDASKHNAIFLLLEGAVQLKHVDSDTMLTFDAMEAGHVFAAERMIGLPLIAWDLHVREYAAFLSFDQVALQKLKQNHIKVYSKLFQAVSYSIIAQLRNISIHLIRIGCEGSGETDFYIDY